MKPYLSEVQPDISLQNLGRASAQIVHDLKNQLNGLKLYATFLRKRLEKSDRPSDELETVNKLLIGLDRTAADLTMIAQFGQPVELKKQPGVDLQKLMRTVAAGLNEGPRTSGSLTGPVVVETNSLPLIGDFDSVVLSDALKAISLSAMKLLGTKDREQSLQVVVSPQATGSSSAGIIEWQGFHELDHDPFHSFKGSDEIRLSLAARAIEAHGGSAEKVNGALRVSLPLTR